MKFELIEKTKDERAIVDELFPIVKNHLRILHSEEDDLIKLYIRAAVETIEKVSSRDIFYREYQVDVINYDNFVKDGYVYCGKSPVNSIKVFDNNGKDISPLFAVNKNSGIIRPNPFMYDVLVITGYETLNDIPSGVVNIIMRVSAEYYEERQSARVGEVRYLPKWAEYALSTIWTPRC